tara:strand:- start:2727 stop:2909 length:183 start_codon:yes stop_codon:yes gene_type:complete
MDKKIQEMIDNLTQTISRMSDKTFKGDQVLRKNGLATNYKASKQSLQKKKDYLIKKYKLK